jgi:tRNA(Ile)-lysidine synthase
VAHVDHGWRKGSQKEAKGLQKGVEKMGFSFSGCRLKNVAKKEEAAREARYAFFEKIYHKLDCQAVVLGHQGDDQAETVLKRVFEGAGIAALGGMRKVAWRGEMVLWRPLLEVAKADLVGWLTKRGIKWIEDETNLDENYLRGRMRQKILPALEVQFGKKMGQNLIRLGEFAQELEDYFNERLQKYERVAEENRLDLAPFYPCHPLELKFLIKKFAQSRCISLSHKELTTLAHLLNKYPRRHTLAIKNGTLYTE